MLSLIASATLWKLKESRKKAALRHHSSCLALETGFTAGKRRLQQQ